MCKYVSVSTLTYIKKRQNIFMILKGTRSNKITWLYQVFIQLLLYGAQ